MRLTLALAAAGNDDGTLGQWAREHGIGGVVVVVVAIVILVLLLSGLARLGKKKN